MEDPLVGFRCGSSTALALRHRQSDITPWTLVHSLNEKPKSVESSIHADQLVHYANRVLMADGTEFLGDLPEVMRELDKQRVKYLNRVIFVMDNSTDCPELAPEDVSAFTRRFDGLAMRYTVYWIREDARISIEHEHVKIISCSFDAIPKDLRRRSIVVPAYTRLYWKDGKKPDVVLCTDLGGSAPRPRPIRSVTDDDVFSLGEHTYHDQYRVLIWSGAELDRVEYYTNWLTRTVTTKPVLIHDVSIDRPFRHRTAGVAICSEIIRLQNHTNSIDDIGSVKSALDSIDQIALRRSNRSVLDATDMIRRFLSDDKTDGELYLTQLRRMWNDMRPSSSTSDLSATGPTGVTGVTREYEAASLDLIWNTMNGWLLTVAEAKASVDMGRAFTVGTPLRRPMF